MKYATQGHGFVQESDAGARHFLQALLLLDAAFISLHVFAALFHADPKLGLGVDRSYGEFYQYFKLGLTSGLCACAAVRFKLRGFLLWALLFLYMLADDAMRLHEQGGKFIAEHLHWSDAFGLRGRDLGEMFVFGCVGMLMLAILVINLYSSSKPLRIRSLDIAFLIFVLALFGVGVDALHVMFANFAALELILGTIEDGGELVTISFIVAYVYWFLSADRSDSVTIIGWLRARYRILDALYPRDRAHKR